MALDPCRECGKEISTEAQSCPHCGAPDPFLTAQWQSAAQHYSYLSKRERTEYWETLDEDQKVSLQKALSALSVDTPDVSHKSPSERFWSPGIAAVLSLFIPGAGQMYKGQIFAGIAWLIAVVIGYFLLIIPGLVLHLLCIITAASGDPYRR